jgi:hypothetical protein
MIEDEELRYLPVKGEMSDIAELSHWGNSA